MERVQATFIVEYNSSIFVSNEGDVYSIGCNNEGVLGHDEQNVFPHKVISSLKHIVSISCGFYHTACLDNEGTVFTFGANQYGQLGVGKDEEILYCTHLPQKVTLPPIKQIACGGSSTICLSKDKELFSFGDNAYGQLGLGDNYFRISPCKVESIKDIEFVEIGCDFSFCKTMNGEFYCWGANDKGQLGIGNKDDQFIPYRCFHFPPDIVDLKCGEKHTLMLLANQTVKSCGENFYNQLGRETIGPSCTFETIENLKDIIRIECGKFHSLCMDINQSFYVFGSNVYGQLGLGHCDKVETPIKHPLILSNVVDISKGGCSVFIKTSNNEIYAFGYNEYSQLGIKTENDNQITPIRVFEDNEDIWFSNIPKSKAKSARSIL